MCVYIAFYYWYWGKKKCAVIGDMKNGYIVTPIKDYTKNILQDNNLLKIVSKGTIER